MGSDLCFFKVGSDLCFLKVDSDFWLLKVGSDFAGWILEVAPRIFLSLSISFFLDI